MTPPFHKLTAEYTAAGKNAEFAEEARREVARALNASLDEVASLARSVRETGHEVPVALRASNLWQGIVQARDLAELHAILEQHAPAAPADA